ncbi:MAG: hypothetical protein GC158_13665 [Cyanobacteria bacterium RI_101]|nr:hypothetical protein [Cyanobacteria bacterium RI_101]
MQNKKPWKQVTTNVPPHMYQALKKQVTKERTMSQVLRELIAESDVMRAGTMPRPSWSMDLAHELTEMRRELAELKADVRSAAEARAKSTSQPSYNWQVSPTWQPPALKAVLAAREAAKKEAESASEPEPESASDLPDLYDSPDPYDLDISDTEDNFALEAADFFKEFQAKREETEAPADVSPQESEPETKTKPFAFLGKLTGLLGVRKTA